MMPPLRAGLLAGTLMAALAPALAHAGGSGASKSCGCNIPTGHTVDVPGVNISPPSVVVNSPSIYISAPQVQIQSASAAYAQSSADAQSSSSASASSDAQSQALANAQAAGQASANAAGSAFSNALAAANSFGSGGGGAASNAEGVTSFIPSLQVEGVETPEARRVCAQFRAAAKVVAVQAVCLDDKAVPHPASQVTPDRDILPAYEGELYRCIAGARMQYTLADYSGSADFARGQTVSCLKGEALYHSATGQIACRPQRPARDCNERSLLRRYGAGIKVRKLALAQECVAYTTQTAQSASPGSLQLDGGVGH